MVKVNVVSNVKRSSVIVDENTTLRAVLTGEGIDINRGGITLDGIPLQVGDLDKSFAGLGLHSEASLFQVVKADNA